MGTDRNEDAGSAGERVGYVYFVLAPSVKRIKIGYASYDPNARFLELNIGSPVTLEKHSLMRARQSVEGELHRRFARHRVKGEWFRTHPSLMAFIAENARPWRELFAGQGEAIDPEVAARLEEERRKAEEQRAIWNRHYLDCYACGLDPMMTPLGQVRKSAILRHRRSRYGPLQKMLDELKDSTS